jgi:hypothetical protein
MTIQDYLLRCRELSHLTTQNGWIDDTTLRYRIVARDGNHVVASVGFDELVMEGGGCLAARVPCFGQVCFDLDSAGEVERLEVLWPRRTATD